jgi:hypothetical protein
LANRAVVKSLFDRGVDKKEQFVLKKNDDGWKIDTKKYGFPDEKNGENAKYNSYEYIRPSI